MKVIRFVVGVIALNALWSCSQKDVISISGQINNPGNIRVVAFYEGDRKLDSVFLGDHHKFKFERQATQPRLLSVELGKNRYPIILIPGEKIQFVTDLQNPEQYDIVGSELSSKLKEFAPTKRRKELIQDSLQASFVKATAGKSEIEIENLRSEYLTSFKQELNYYTKKVVEFANENQNLAGFYAVSTLDPEIAEQEIIAYAEQIHDQFTENRYVNQFKEEAAKLKILAVGQPAPEFEAYTPDNRIVKLSDYRGKLTLIDFWASWCVPCRKENPNIVRLYDQYRDKGFAVLGVSFDNNPGSWMRAIEEDKLTWTNISDLKAWNSDLVLMYRIMAIPASVLVDANGNIAAKNLRGKELGDFLSKALN
ncbi:AhpC/TSA family protein [Sphingobacterium olei]|uniref:AhpC/TSA family protein n=1 Tax=Sphingobacterium olei TaxID=2571155 RepID=A0A4U0P2J4_9SPHI|nr:TlpA disulfide reductase family protein [Sphingobacterium olei]TJZ61455.1 AhpC/TSA family protein [Sphingobacterium olei]